MVTCQQEAACSRIYPYRESGEGTGREPGPPPTRLNLLKVPKPPQQHHQLSGYISLWGCFIQTTTISKDPFPGPPSFLQAPPPKVSMNSPKEHLSWGPGHVQNVNQWAGPVLTTTNSSGVREYPALFDRHCEKAGPAGSGPITWN